MKNTINLVIYTELNVSYSVTAISLIVEKLRKFKFSFGNIVDIGV